MTDDNFLNTLAKAPPPRASAPKPGAPRSVEPDLSRYARPNPPNAGPRVVDESGAQEFRGEKPTKKLQRGGRNV